VKKTDPELKNTLIVVTADHDHTLVLNGYAKRTGKTTAGNAGVLGLVKNYETGEPSKDSDGMPYTIIGFGNGYNRWMARAATWRPSTTPPSPPTTITRRWWSRWAR
jgi:alkaline phosphatase